MHACALFLRLTGLREVGLEGWTEDVSSVDFALWHFGLSQDGLASEEHGAFAFSGEERHSASIFLRLHICSFFLVPERIEVKTKQGEKSVREIIRTRG